MSLRIIASSRFFRCGRLPEPHDCRSPYRRNEPGRHARGDAKSHVRLRGRASGTRAPSRFRPCAIRSTIVAKQNKPVRRNPMINRRTFAALLAGTIAAPKRAWSEPVTAKTVFYTSVGPEMTLFDIDL